MKKIGKREDVVRANKDIATRYVRALHSTTSTSRTTSQTTYLMSYTFLDVFLMELTENMVEITLKNYQNNTMNTMTARRRTSSRIRRPR